jgi:hypothetical protein
MAHFANIGDDNIVVRVIVIDNENAEDPAPENSEKQGQDFIKNVLNLSGNWKQCSYNSKFRKQYPGVGFSYDSENDVFISPQPHPSWSLDSNYDWQPPSPKPEEEGQWEWDEDSLSWTDVSEKE